jgi:hypothetical protein
VGVVDAVFIHPHLDAALAGAGARGQVGHLDVGGNKLVRENKILVHEVGERCAGSLQNYLLLLRSGLRLRVSLLGGAER